MIYKLNSIVWGAPLLILLLGTGLIISIRIKFFQIKKFGYILKNTFLHFLGANHQQNQRIKTVFLSLRQFPLPLRPQWEPAI